MLRKTLCGLAFVHCLSLAFAQDTRGMIFGHVLDAQKSVIAGASVVVTNTDTNTSTRLQSNETGYYEANLLLPGNYTVTAASAGFRTSVRRGIALPVSTRFQIDVTLEVGAVTENVVVTAEAPLLETNTVSSGRVLDNRSLTDLPVLNNSPVLLSKYVPGVQTTGTTPRIALHSAGGASDYRGDLAVGANQWSIDGVPNVASSRRIAYIPHGDTIQEFKVETANFDAAIGQTTGLNVTMLSKTGGNQFHGALSEQHWQQRWNGTGFFVKQQYYRDIAAAESAGDSARAAGLRATDKQPPGRSNTYSASLGGPVILPKIFNGKDKLFFFTSFAGVNSSRSDRPADINFTIPTLAARKGDFSSMLNIDPVRYQIYDPLSVRVDPARSGHFIRDPIPNNVLPQSRIVNPAYNTYLKFLPTPNNDPLDSSLEATDNYRAVGMPNTLDYYAGHARMDYHHSARSRFFGRWSWSGYWSGAQDWTYETAPGLHSGGNYRINHAGTVDWVYTANASTVLDVAAAVTDNFGGSNISAPLQYKPSDVGLPAYMDARVGDYHILPSMNVTGYEAMGYTSYPAETWLRILTLKSDLSHIRGAHTIRAGFDGRFHYRDRKQPTSNSGAFTFNNTYTRKNDDTLTPAGTLGHGWAAFMMGLPSAMSISTSDTFAVYSPYYAWYVQDNWRLTQRLSVNLGLRLEYEIGPTERHNRLLTYFDPAAVLPITEGAQAAYAKSPLTELPASAFQVRGGSLYAGVGGTSRQMVQSELMWQPRIAVAYQATPKTVLRGGYGMFHDTFNATYPTLDQTGFSRNTTTSLTNDFGMTWLAGNPGAGISPLADPFPVRSDGTRFDEPTRDQLGTMARVGRGWSFAPFDAKRARVQRWRLGIQRQLGSRMVLDVAYAGSYADRVSVSQKLDPLAEQYWADGLVRNNAAASDMNANVTNPFRLQNFAALQQSQPVIWQDMATTSFYTSSTIRKNQLLRSYPHMNSLTSAAAPIGKARTDAIEISFERRFANGFNFNIGYTGLRGRTADAFYDEFDPAPTWVASNSSRPHRFTATSVFELPFGQGRALLQSGPLSWIVGGWQVGVIYEYQPGALLSFGNLFYYGNNLGDITSGSHTLDRWFNTDGFERTSSKAPAAFHRRMFDPYVPGLRADMTNQWNANLQREFKLKERLAFQLRLDAINLQNRSQFAAPGTNPVATNFGQVTVQADSVNRFIQIQGRLQF